MKTRFKVLLLVSLLVNAATVYLLKTHREYIAHLQTEHRRVDERRQKNIKMLEAMMAGRIDKALVTKILREKFSDEESFEKDQKRGLSVYGLYFIFDAKNKLERIEISDMREKTI
jgi:hypothetical protein